MIKYDVIVATVSCVSVYVYSQGDLFVNGNRVVLRQIPFNHGIIYGIDGVLMPPGEGGDCDVPTTPSVWVSNFMALIIISYHTINVDQLLRVL